MLGAEGFYEALGVDAAAAASPKKIRVAPAAAAGRAADDAVDALSDGVVRLLTVDVDGGDDGDDDARRVTTREVTTRPLTREMLTSDSIAFVTAGGAAYCWAGMTKWRSLDAKERHFVTRAAAAFAADPANKARLYLHWFPYDRVRVVNAHPYLGLLRAHLSAYHPSLSIPTHLGAVQLQLTPFNSTPTSLCVDPRPYLSSRSASPCAS